MIGQYVDRKKSWREKGGCEIRVRTQDALSTIPLYVGTLAMMLSVLTGNFYYAQFLDKMVNNKHAKHKCAQTSVHEPYTAKI